MADYLDREHEDLYCGMIKNCVVGYGIVIAPLVDSRGLIGVDPCPIDDDNDGEELRTFMKEIIASWSHQLDTIPFPKSNNDNDPLPQ